jgi:hypothetical protein
LAGIVPAPSFLALASQEVRYSAYGTLYLGHNLDVRVKSLP